MTEKQYRLDLAYKGTNFQGWQTQPEKNGVQDHLEAALKTILRHETKVVGSSRTDSGVHAEHQVASFFSGQEVQKVKLVRGLNALLPGDIKVQSVAEVGASFHPIRSSTAKLYRYVLYVGDGPSPFLTDYIWKTFKIDNQLLGKALESYIGFHNFQSFCATDSSAKTFERKILDIRMVRKGDYFEIYLLGEGFLKQMVRNLIGTAVDISQGRIELARLPDILASRNRTAAGQTAPACGLSLLAVYFQNEPKSLVGLDVSTNSFEFRLL